MEEEKQALVLSGDPESAAALARDYERQGHRTAFRNLYRKRLEAYSALANETYVSPMVFATFNALLGEKEKAFAWLQKAFAEHSPWLMYIKYDPTFESLRSDPRFKDLLHRVGYPS